MSLLNNGVIVSRNITLAILTLFCVISSAQAQTLDSQKCGTTVGSAGTVDEADTGKIKFNHSTAKMGTVPVIVAVPQIAAPVKEQRGQMSAWHFHLHGPLSRSQPP